MSLRVVATIVAKPGSEQVVGDALSGLARATRDGEDGCLSYELFRSQSDPTTFVTIEEWTDQAALDAHMQTPHMAEALAAAGEHLASAPGIHPLEARD